MKNNFMFWQNFIHYVGLVNHAKFLLKALATLDMGTLIELKQYKTQKADQAGFSRWEERLGEPCNHRTRVADLSGKSICYLATPGEESSTAFFELIMGVLDLGEPAAFSRLEKQDQIRVIDTHLFMADQIRLEILFRLKWLSRYFCQNTKLMDMIIDFTVIREKSNGNPPEMSESYPDYDTYAALTEREKDAFIRQLLPESLEAFRTTLLC